MSYELNVYNTQKNKTFICLKTIDLESSMKQLHIKLSSFLSIISDSSLVLQVGQETFADSL